jgi:transcription elongation factor Elf1
MAALNGGRAVAKEMEMGLGEKLSDVALTFDCPDCSHPTVRKGSALRTIAHINCDGCNAKVRITYPLKLAIFEKHLRLASKGALQLA